MQKHDYMNCDPKSTVMSTYMLQSSTCRCLSFMGRRRSRDKSTELKSDSSPSSSSSLSSVPASLPTPTPEQVAAQIAEDAAWKREHEYMSYQLNRRGMMIKRVSRSYHPQP